MPSAGDVVGEARSGSCWRAPGPRGAAPRGAPAELGEDPARACGARARRAGHHAALVQVVVFGYYTDAGVRERLGYPGQVAKTLYSWKVPDFIEEGLIDKVLARGRSGRTRSPAGSPSRVPS